MLKQVWEMWWLIRGLGGSDEDVVAHKGIRWLRWGCGGSHGDVVTQMGMCWLRWDVVAQWVKSTCRELEFSLLPSSALKCVPRIVTIRGRIAKNRITDSRSVIGESMNLRADCHRLDLTSATWARNWERFAKKLFLLWQSAAFDRGT
jgi:hypothetical protein